MKDVLEILQAALDLADLDDAKSAIADAILVAENTANDPRPATTDTAIIEKILNEHGDELHRIANFLQGMAKPDRAPRKPVVKAKPVAKKGVARGRRSGR